MPELFDFKGFIFLICAQQVDELVFWNGQCIKQHDHDKNQTEIKNGLSAGSGWKDKFKLRKGRFKHFGRHDGQTFGKEESQNQPDCQWDNADQKGLKH